MGSVVADTKAGYRLSGGPLVARGKVMIGTQDTGGRSQGGNYISGSTPRPAPNRGGSTRSHARASREATAGTACRRKRNGGSVWIPPSYDAVHNPALFGTGNTYDTVGLRDLGRRTASPTMPCFRFDARHQSRDRQARTALPASGERPVDLDWAFERQVMQIREWRSADRRGDRRQADDLDMVEAETGSNALDRSRARAGAAERRHRNRSQDRREDRR
jgi:hypothetical protein